MGQGFCPRSGRIVRRWRYRLRRRDDLRAQRSRWTAGAPRLTAPVGYV